MGLANCRGSRVAGKLSRVSGKLSRVAGKLSQGAGKLSQEDCEITCSKKKRFAGIIQDILQ